MLTVHIDYFYPTYTSLTFPTSINVWKNVKAVAKSSLLFFFYMHQLGYRLNQKYVDT